MRKNWLDYLRVLAVTGVVTIHATSHHYDQLFEKDPGTWWLANLLNSAARFSVPMFVMISGCLLLNQNISVLDFYKKRMIRLVPATVIWSMFYIAFMVVTQTGITDLGWFLRVGLWQEGAAYGHLWYLSMLLCLMVFAPHLNYFVRGIAPTRNELQLLLGGFFLFLCAFQLSTVVKEIVGLHVDWFKTFPLYMGYFLAGHYVDKHHAQIRLSNRAGIACIVLLLASGCLLNYWVAHRFNVVKDSFILSNLGPLVALITMIAFILFIKNATRLPESPLVSAIAASSFGIYLIHPVFLYYFRIWLSPDRINASSYMLLEIFVAFVLSFTAIHCLRKMRYFRWIS
ncbi:MAG: acyltransferase [Burkholderiaceae bacterium]|nr:MAG: acyltransferase [Burkholderiaceae bacterium]